VGNNEKKPFSNNFDNQLMVMMMNLPLLTGPGSGKPAAIKPKHLKQMTLSVLGPGAIVTAKSTTYTYYGVGKVSEHPDIDFKNKKTFIFVPGYLDNVIFPTGRSLCYIYREMGYNVLMFDIINFTTEVLPM
jgi:hypothetical protein